MKKLEPKTGQPRSEQNGNIEPNEDVESIKEWVGQGFFYDKNQKLVVPIPIIDPTEKASIH